MKWLTEYKYLLKLSETPSTQADGFCEMRSGAALKQRWPLKLQKCGQHCPGCISLQRSVHAPVCESTVLSAASCAFSQPRSSDSQQSKPRHSSGGASAVLQLGACCSRGVGLLTQRGQELFRNQNQAASTAAATYSSPAGCYRTRWYYLPVLSQEEWLSNLFT